MVSKVLGKGANNPLRGEQGADADEANDAVADVLMSFSLTDSTLTRLAECSSLDVKLPVVSSVVGRVLDKGVNNPLRDELGCWIKFCPAEPDDGI